MDATIYSLHFEGSREYHDFYLRSEIDPIITELRTAVEKLYCNQRSNDVSPQLDDLYMRVLSVSEPSI